MDRNSITLVNSWVVFDEATHTYTLGDKNLVGITGLIHDKVFPDMYNGIPAAVLNKAAERGKSVHQNIEDHDRGMFACQTPELINYKKGCTDCGLVHEDSEYIVTDREHYASAIDKVYRLSETEFALADIKTTSKLNIEYVSWQLSIYAYLFEKQVVGAKAKVLYAIWLRGDEYRFVEVERKSQNDVERLLSCGITGEDFITKTEVQQLPDNVIATLQQIADIEVQAKALLDQSKTLREAIEKEMRERNIVRWDNDVFEVSLTSDYEKKAFDTTKFKKEHPDMVDAYMKTSRVKGHLSFKIK